MKDHVILALVLPAASCLDRAVVVPVSSVLVLPCGGVDGLPPALDEERVVLLIKLRAVFLPDRSISVFSSVQFVITCLHCYSSGLHHTTNEMLWRRVVHTRHLKLGRSWPSLEWSLPPQVFQ